jgi:hypothetical protein
MMEEWNTGTMSTKKRKFFNIIPLFQYSNIPILRGGFYGTIREGGSIPG